MRKFFIPLFILLSLSLNAQKVINIQPLGDVSPDVINVITSSVKKFYGYKCVVNPKVDFTKDILADSKTRYEASRILSKFNSKQNLLIITEKDIACKNGNIPEWGIFGLGYRPGVTCVVSTFRIKRKVSQDVFNDRLIKICLHEIGHNLGLDHCKSGDHRCMMNDANGTIKEVDEEQIFFCKNCWRLIGKN
jgi:archaemetzincin